ncbi:hypothetical protein FSARC_13133 [Fusarium sarcochroum]|uniref:Uncharacterized protein n=1 Tax=Fusarium sarcochroum TaxID=1208366 RepID=A0A8H4WTV2_9HYPO|nr:hypothetical protein FSARC_13133 [Fusarium sarcochroum]
MNSAVTPQLSDQAVYQATKDIFKGTVIQELASVYGDESFHRVVLKLLSEKVYESTSIASHRFPDLFEPSVVQSTARDELEAEAIRNEEATPEGIIQTQWTDCQGVFDCGGITEALGKSENGLELHFGSSSSSPVYLPFPVEHQLMEKLQKTLELICYKYGTEALQDTLQERGWDCPQAAELSEWAGVLSREGISAKENTRKPSKDFLRSIANIRHTAVHRLRTNSIGLERFLADAEDFAQMLGDTIQTGAISNLRSDASSVISELTQNKQLLQLQLEKTQVAIKQQRAELDRREQEAVDYMRKEDQKYQFLAGEKLRKALKRTEETGNCMNALSADVNGLDSVEDIAEDSDDMDEFEDCNE